MIINTISKSNSRVEEIDRAVVSAIVSANAREDHAALVRANKTANFIIGQQADEAKRLTDNIADLESQLAAIRAACAGWPTDKDGTILSAIASAKASMDHDGETIRLRNGWIDTLTRQLGEVTRENDSIRRTINYKLAPGLYAARGFLSSHKGTETHKMVQRAIELVENDFSPKKDT